MKILRLPLSISKFLKWRVPEQTIWVLTIVRVAKPSILGDFKIGEFELATSSEIACVGFSATQSLPSAASVTHLKGDPSGHHL